MATLLLTRLLILAPAEVFAQTAAPASGPQPTSAANPPTDRFQDFGFGYWVNAVLNIAREFAPELMRLVPFW
jgi:hypothetical protein